MRILIKIKLLAVAFDGISIKIYKIYDAVKNDVPSPFNISHNAESKAIQNKIRLYSLD